MLQICIIKRNRLQRWSDEEEVALLQLADEHRIGKRIDWVTVAAKLNTQRTGKSLI